MIVRTNLFELILEITLFLSGTIFRESYNLYPRRGRGSLPLELRICALAPRRYPIQVPFPFQVDACSLFAIWRTKKGTAANDVCKVGNWQIFLQIFIQTSYEEGVEFARPITWLPSYVKDPSDGGGGGGSINRSDLSSVSSASRRN